MSRAELAYYVPEPAIVLLGCAPHVPDHGFAPPHESPPFHAPRNPEAIGEATLASDGKLFRWIPNKRGRWTPERCPVCRGSIDRDSDARRDRVYCGRCDGMSDRPERRLQTLRRLVDAESKAAADLADEARDLETVRVREVTLPEVTRRRLWNGYKGGTADALELPPESSARRERERRQIDRIRVAREWLRSIGQEPNWTLLLDARGRVVGRAIDATDEAETPPLPPFWGMVREEAG